MARAAQIALNLARVRERMAEAARRAGRNPADVTLVAVTKYGDVDAARAVVEAGCHDLGESRPQELWRKADELSQAGLEVRWHMIGHLQRNKVRRTLPLVKLLHSADSERLILEVDRIAQELGLAPVPILLEVNVSGDPNKGGFKPEEVEPLLQRLGELKHIAVQGAMAMGGVEGDLDAARRSFATLRELVEKWRAVTPPTIRLAELSMGMSDDYEIAIEEGATIIRVGSALFE